MNWLRAGGWFFWLGFFAAAGLPAGRALASPIYNGGVVMTGTPHVYFIWYGDWSSNSATTVLPSFINNLNGTNYMNIITSYSTGPYTLGNQVEYMGGAYVNSTTNSSIYTMNGTSLDGYQGTTGTGTIASIVSGVLSANASWASDSQGIFDVLTASNISVSGLGSTFCGWHYSTNWGNKSTLGNQYGLIADPTGTSCLQSTHNSPDSTNVAADTMTSTVAHELFETVTDPTGRAWFDAVAGSGTSGYEVADMCQNSFGTITSSNGQNYNTTLNGTNYALQQIWLNQGGGSGYTGGACTLSTPEPASLALLLPGIIGLAAVRWRSFS